MEEKNKNENHNNSHGHKKPQKQRSYFLEPRDNQANKDAQDNQKKQAAPAQPQKKEEKPNLTQADDKTINNGAQKNHKHNKKKHKRPTQQSSVPTDTAEMKPAEAEAPSAQNNERGDNRQQGSSKNHKNKHKNNDKNRDNKRKSDDALSNPLIIPMPVPQKESIFNNDEFEEVPFNFEDEAPVIADNNAEAEKETPADENQPKVEIIGIRFKSNSKVYYFSPEGKKFTKGSHAIVETARGLEYGEVAIANSLVNESDTVPPIRPAIRTATKEDDEHHRLNKIKEDEAFKLCNERIMAHGLDMKLIEAQYTFDNTKLLFYFSSAGRVDFRELVKDLASVFRTRIELRQIGIRDEAKIMGGLGICGRPLCCAHFLTDFGQVSIKMAKEQNLSLNSAKISGICGRLMCCLRYEQETYEYEIKRTPPVDSYVRTENGDGVVTEISPLAGTIKVRLLASPEVPPKTYKREDVTVLRKKKNSN